MPITLDSFQAGKSMVEQPPLETLDQYQLKQAATQAKTAEVGEGLRQLQEMNSDRQILDQAVKTGQYDLSSPQGMESLYKDVGSKLSASANQKLAQTLDTQRRQYTAYQDQLSKLPIDELKLRTDQFNFQAPNMAAFLNFASKQSQEKGEQAGEQFFKENWPKFLQHLSTQSIGGKPAVSPDDLQNMSQWDMNTLRQRLQATPMMMSAATETLKNAQASAAMARAESLKNPSDWQEWTADGNRYFVSKKNQSKAFQVTPTGDWVPTTVPANAKKLGTKEAGSPGVGGGGTSTAAPEPNDNRDWLVRYKVAGGTSIDPGKLGNSSAAAKERILFQNRFAEMARQAGISPEDAAENSYVISKIGPALQNSFKQETVLNVGVKELNRVLPRLTEYVKELGGPDSPLARKAWNTMSTDVLGSDKFSRINADTVAIKEQLAKVLSGASGTGATPVSYLHLTEALANPNISLAQIKGVADELNKIFIDRQTAVEDERKALLANLHKTNLSPEKPAQKDERIDIISKESQDALKSFYDAKTPVDKHRKWEDYKGTLKERLRLGEKLKQVTVDDIKAGKLQAGDVFNGLVFRGGDYRDKNNWEKL